MKIENKLLIEPKLGFDIRNVSYEKIHFINQDDFDFFINELDIKEYNKILDVGCGYGAVTREILISKSYLKPKLYLLDIFKTQLERAIKKFNELFSEKKILDSMSFNLENIESTSFKDGFFDRIVAKMVYHELPISNNSFLKALCETNRILKKSGKLLIWDVALNQTNQTLIQDIVRKKDDLAGFDYLVKNRYLPRLDEWLFFLNEAGFKDIEIKKEISYIFNTELRLESEFNNESKKLDDLNNYIRAEVKKYPSELLDEIEYNDYSSGVSFKIPKVIISASK